VINSPVYGNHTEIKDASGTVEHVGTEPNMARDRAEIPIARYLIDYRWWHHHYADQ